MPRKKVIVSSDFPYHVSARCLNKDWFKLPIEFVWDLMEDYLFLTTIMFEIRIHSFVLMPNHFHLIASTPQANISESMQFFMGQTSREITRLAGRINQTWGSRHNKCLISSYHYYLNAYKYVYRNPVKAKLVDRVEDWPYSTCRGLLGQCRLSIPLSEDTLLFGESFNANELDWLNKRPDSSHEELVRRALHKSEFKFPGAALSGGKHPLETELM